MKVASGMDRDEFALRFQAIYRRLWLVAASIVGDRTEADDIVQEAAVIAFQKLDEFASGTNFGAWVTQIVKFCAANHNRKSTRRRTLAADPSTLDQLTDPPSIEQPVDHAECLSAFQSAFGDNMFRVLKQLSEDARACLWLRVIDELSYAEIGELLAIPEGTAMSHVHRSKKLMRRNYSTDESARREVPYE